MMFSKLFLFLLVMVKLTGLVRAQTAKDFRCVVFNEKLQKMNSTDSTLNALAIYSAKELSFYLINKKDPKAKVTIVEMVVTINRVRQKISEYTITGNKIPEGNEFYEEFKLCVPGDMIYVDHIVFKTLTGETKSFNKGFVLILK